MGSDLCGSGGSITLLFIARDCGKVTAITAAAKAKFLTAASFFGVARAAPFRCARASATTFDIFYRLQVTNFGLLKPAPNGLNYMNIRRLFAHGHRTFTGLAITRRCLVDLSITKRDT